jgi:ribosomal protein L39E
LIVLRPCNSKARLARILRENPAIPLFADYSTHSSVPLAAHAAVARSGGQGRP